MAGIAEATVMVVVIAAVVGMMTVVAMAVAMMKDVKNKVDLWIKCKRVHHGAPFFYTHRKRR